MMEPENRKISIERQCQLLGLSRSSYYYAPVGESSLNLHLMDLIDEQYTRTPYYGVEKMTAWLREQKLPASFLPAGREHGTVGVSTIHSSKGVSIRTS